MVRIDTRRPGDLKRGGTLDVRGAGHALCLREGAKVRPSGGAETDAGAGTAAERIGEADILLNRIGPDVVRPARLSALGSPASGGAALSVAGAGLADVATPVVHRSGVRQIKDRRDGTHGPAGQTFKQPAARTGLTRERAGQGIEAVSIHRRTSQARARAAG